MGGGWLVISSSYLPSYQPRTAGGYVGGMTASTRTGKCLKCGAPSNPNGIGGALERCEACKLLAARARRAKWAHANPGADRAAKDKWAAANSAKVAASKAGWVEANREKHNADGKAWKKANPEAMRIYHLRKYGLTLETYAALIASQSGRCAVCDCAFTEKRRPCIDHCHDRKHVRALLCVQCNAALGQFRERPEYMEAAARYIRKHNGVLK